MNQDDRIKELFQDALELPLAERTGFLEELAARDRPAWQSVRNLLDAHDRAATFLERPAELPPELRDDGSGAERRGDRIGPFELLQRIGVGGFGTVWRARQSAPMQREVALKVVKLGMDTAEVVRRFDQEREVLARMDHPHIAKVLDAGVSPDGRPWFAMELVDGEPITAYCERRGLALRERVELFVQVCDAIQHAHHKGIVHRDIKPTNVLVATRDGRPVPRVIDFGIAKALDHAGAELTAMTQERRLLGTPEYMSPEQVETWGADVDARTDLYSLGVLLYELLTGSRPFDLRRIGPGRFDELLRAVREEPPQRPSQRVLSHTLGVGVEAGAAERARRLRGDLDWILLRALEKDRRRRYATPAQLAADLVRHLRDEPVVAGPPSLGYRLRKLARRHRASFAAAVLVLLSMVLGTALAVGAMLDARAAERAERTARERAQRGEAEARLQTTRLRKVLAEMDELLIAADPQTRHGPDYTVRELLDEFAARLGRRAYADAEIEARMHAVVGRTYRHLGAVAAAEPHLERALELREQLADGEPELLCASRTELAWLRDDQGAYHAAVRLNGQSLATLRGLPDATPALAGALAAQALFLSHAERHAEAIEHSTEALALTRVQFGAEHPETARCAARDVLVRFTAGHLRGARARLQAAHDALLEIGDATEIDRLTLRQNLATLAELDGDLETAGQLQRAVLERRRELFGAGHPVVASSEVSLGWVLRRRGRLDEARALLEHAAEVFGDRLGALHPNVVQAMLRLGDVLAAQGEIDRALPLLEKAAGIARGNPGGGRMEVESRSNLASALWAAERYDRAVTEMQAAVDRAREVLEAADPTLVNLLMNLSWMRAESGDDEAAVPLLEESLALSRRMWPDDHPQVELQRQRLAALRGR